MEAQGLVFVCSSMFVNIINIIIIILYIISII